MNFSNSKEAQSSSGSLTPELTDINFKAVATSLNWS